MKKSKTVSLLMVMVVLVGCNSFNKYELKDDTFRGVPRYPNWDRGMTADKPVEESSGRDMGTCPPFQMPELPKRPDLPYQLLSQIKPGDDAAIDAVYQKHIIDLRNHAINVERIVRKAYSRYTEDCASYIAKQALPKQ